MRQPLMIGMVAAVLAVGGAAMVAAAAGVPPMDRPRTATSSSATSSSVTASPSTISRSDAERIAVNAVPGGHVTEADLQTVGGRPAWDVDISTATGLHEVVVDAANGQILSDRPNGESSEPDPISAATPTPASPTCADGPGHDVAEDHCGH